MGADAAGRRQVEKIFMQFIGAPGDPLLGSD